MTFWSRHSTKKRVGSLDEEDDENERQEGNIVNIDQIKSHIRLYNLIINLYCYYFIIIIIIIITLTIELYLVTIGEDDQKNNSDEHVIVKYLYKICCLAQKSNSMQDTQKDETNDLNLQNDQPSKQASEFLWESTFHRR